MSAKIYIKKLQFNGNRFADEREEKKKEKKLIIRVMKVVLCICYSTYS